jgi:cyclohexadieny/prephenate dehydrogenase
LRRAAAGEGARIAAPLILDGDLLEKDFQMMLAATQLDIRPVASRIYEKIAILGCGMIGSSIARAVGRSDCARRLVAYDRCPVTRARLSSLRLADAVCATAREAVADADLVIIAIPVGGYRELLLEMADHLKPGAVVTDVGSVKLPVQALFEELLPAHVHHIPGHPIAGVEKSGPDAGSESLFRDAWMILTPHADHDSDALEDLCALWRRLGARVTTMTSADHDAILSVTSHLPHLLSFCMIETAQGCESRLGSHFLQFSAGGFRDFTRIAGSDPVMWRDIFLQNRTSVLDVLSDYSAALADLRKSIVDEDGERLLTQLTRIKAAHARACLSP